MSQPTPVRLFETKRQELLNRLRARDWKQESIDLVMASVRPGNIDDVLKTLDRWDADGI